MSRIILSKHSGGSSHVVVGWDHPAAGAFWQEWASPEEIEQAERDMEKAEKTGIGPHSQTVQIAETGVKREGGMWPGLSLPLAPHMPADLQHYVTADVEKLLYQHAEDPESGYDRKKALVDLTDYAPETSFAESNQGLIDDGIVEH